MTVKSKCILGSDISVVLDDIVDVLKKSIQDYIVVGLNTRISTEAPD